MSASVSKDAHPSAPDPGARASIPQKPPGGSGSPAQRREAKQGGQHPKASYAAVAAKGVPAVPGRAPNGNGQRAHPKNKKSVKAREARIRRAVPALTLPTIWLPLPDSPKRVATIRNYLWGLFRTEYYETFGTIRVGDEQTLLPFVYCTCPQDARIGLQIDTMEHLLTVLESPITVEGTQYHWSAAGGIAYPLVICNVEPTITAPRIEAAMRPHGTVIKLDKYYDAYGNWFGSWSMILEAKPGKNRPTVVKFHGAAELNSIVLASKAISCADCCRIRAAGCKCGVEDQAEQSSAMQSATNQAKRAGHEAPVPVEDGPEALELKGNNVMQSDDHEADAMDIDQDSTAESESEMQEEDDFHDGPTDSQAESDEEATMQGPGDSDASCKAIRQPSPALSAQQQQIPAAQAQTARPALKRSPEQPPAHRLAPKRTAKSRAMAKISDTTPQTDSGQDNSGPPEEARRPRGHQGVVEHHA
jgi:hypothetical protein